MKKTLLNKILYVFAAFILSLFYVVGVGAMSVSAEGMTVGYSDVLTDLKKDKKFVASDYAAYTYAEIKELNSDEDPENDQKLLEVISLAEGSEKELFLYVYNPTRAELEINAVEVSMYCAYAANPKEFHPVPYEVKLVSTYGVFDKYLVEDFEVSDEADRYYNIIEISREFHEGIDTSISEGTTENKAIPVGKQWYCHYYNDELIYEMGEFNVLEIMPTLVDFIRCNNGFTLGSLVLSGSLDVHYYAFNCADYIIEHIYDADLTYKTRDVHEYDHYTINALDSIAYSDYSENIPLTITDKDTVTYKGKGLFSKTVEWNRILKASAFVKNFEDQGFKFSDSVKETLNNSQWVFCFAETKRESVTEMSTDMFGNITYTGRNTYYTEISNVDILRISFLDVNQKYYNLGVVSDKVTADNKPGAVGGTGVDVGDWWDGFWDHDWEGLWDIIVDGFLGVISAIFAIVLVVVLVKLIIGGIKLLLGRK